MTEPIEDKLQFVSFSSCVDPSFWHKLAKLKLDVDKLEEPVRRIWGYYSNVLPRGLNGVLSVDCSSFNEFPEEGSILSAGKLINKNTQESFKALDKAKILEEEGKELLNSFKNEALDNPQTLSRFIIISFADLKNHKFYYWFAFPAINAVIPRRIDYEIPIENLFSLEEIEELTILIDRRQNYFVLETTKGAITVFNVRDGFEKIKMGLEEFFLVFSDSTNHESYPGWPLRNFIALFAYHLPSRLKKPLTVLFLRWEVVEGKWSIRRSIAQEVIIDESEISWEKSDICVGWERNDKGVFSPRLANLNSSMNPLILAEASVDLNLKLMKWQMVPELNLDVIANAKCLLLGAGTLGCVVARSLLAWGVRKITLVDNANVSYSNPVRQCLYQFADVGKPKAVVAATALKSIFPSVDAEGKVLSIPMPGHPVGESLTEETKATIANLDELSRLHDVIFLLMDSRESRWLPSVMGAAYKKLVINAALGFDSFLVIRHGVKSTESASTSPSTSIPGDRLGCYFCSDVTAPGNSGQSRTLDQQCTVTRPGVSNIAGSLAVELMVSILQHKDGGLAPAFLSAEETNDCILGKIPHSVRGFLGQYHIILPAIEAFTSCVACSENVIEDYLKRGTSFVFDVLNSKKYLEELTGLTKLHTGALIDEIMVLSDNEED